MKLQKEIFKTYSLRLVQTAEELERQGNFIRDLFRLRYYPHIQGSSRASILEIGCNKGFMAKAVGEFLPDSNIFGIDMSPNDIRYAQDTCPPQWTDLFNFRALIFLSLLRRQENMM